MKRVGKVLLKIVLTAGLLALAYRNVSIRNAGHALRDVSPLAAVLFFGLLFLNTMISAWKWRLLLAADGAYVSLRRLFANYMIGSFLNLFLPSTIGGDAYRFQSVRRDSRAATSFSAVMADRLFGFLALSLLGMGFSLIGFRHVDEPRLLWAPVLFFTALLSATGLLFSGSPAKRLLAMVRIRRLKKWFSFIEQCIDIFSRYRVNHRLLAKTLALSFLFQTVLIFCIFLLAHAAGIHVPLILFFVFVPIITMLEAIPLSIYGIGFRDQGYVFFFTQVGLANPREHALTMVLLYLGGTVLYTSLGELFLLVRLWRRPSPSTTATAGNTK